MIIFVPMKMVPISTWIEDSLYMKFKLLCKQRDMSMSQVIRKLIKAEVEAGKK